MDIDILQVQETVTIDRNGSLLFTGSGSADSNKDDTNPDLTSDLLQVGTVLKWLNIHN